MKDIFDQVVLCEKCNVRTIKNYTSLEGFKIRVLECPKCAEIVYHPGDIKEYEEYKKLKTRDFNVKLRMVGNSFCVSIPKEFIDFHKEFEKEFNDLVRMNLDGPGKISMFFYSKKFYNNKEDNIEQ